MRSIRSFRMTASKSWLRFPQEMRARSGGIGRSAFRVDAMLPVPLLYRDLLDCFLYDGERAVVVLRLARELLERLIAHGTKKQGTGAFPQYAPLELPAGKELRVAISSYVLESDKS